MLQMENKAVFYNGISQTPEGEIIATMGANHDNITDFYLNIQNLDLYKENIEMVNTDFTTFVEAFATVID